MIKPLFTRSRPLEAWAYTAIVCLFAGLVLSRTLYSAGLLLMALYWFLHEQSTGLWRRPWFWLMLALPAVVLISDFIQGNPPDGVFFIKLSLPLFPLFFFAWRPGRHQMTIMTYWVMAILFCTALYSIYTYIKAPTEAVDGYKQARVMRVGFYHDHIRISVAMAASILMAAYVATVNTARSCRYICVAYIVFMTLFMHVLIARTGLLALYTGSFVYMVIQLWRNHKKTLLTAMAVMILLPILAYQWLPSFRHRMGFVRYDFGYYSKMEYREGSSDGFRYYSLLSGIDIFKAHPMTGVGFKGLHEANKTWFTSHFPKIRPEEIIQPSSEFVLHAAAAGVPGLLLFLLFAVLPLTDKRLRQNVWFASIYAAIAITWLFEILPENQYGIFITGFFLAFAWWLAEGKEEIVIN